MGDDEDYTPAVRPPNAPGGKRVRFEREGEYEQLLIGGGAQDIEAAIMDSTARNINLIGWTIMGVGDTKGDLGSGTLQELVLQVVKRGIYGHDEKRTIRITGIGLNVEII